MQRFISKWRHDCIISCTAIFLQYFNCIILSSTFAIPSSISLIFLKSTQFAPSQLFLLNILFWISLSGLFFQISRKFLFADKKNSALFLLFPLFWLRVQVARIDGCAMGEVDVMPSSRDADLAELSRASKNFSFLSAAGFLVFFGKIITGSELIDLVQYILPRFTTILKPSVRNRWTVANLLLNVLETYAIKSGITKLEYFESIITVTILLFEFSHHRIKDEIYFETKWPWL